MISLPKAKQVYNKGLETQAAEHWRKLRRGQKMRQVDPALPSSRFPKLVAPLARRNTSLLIQLRTGHVPLNHLHTIGHADTQRCPGCGAAQETVLHFVLQCPKYALQGRGYSYRVRCRLSLTYNVTSLGSQRGLSLGHSRPPERGTVRGIGSRDVLVLIRRSDIVFSGGLRAGSISSAALPKLDSTEATCLLTDTSSAGFSPERRFYPMSYRCPHVPWPWIVHTGGNDFDYAQTENTVKLM